MSVIQIMKLRHLQTLAVFVFAFILLTVGWYLYLRKDGSRMMTYTNAKYGVSFAYPKGYTLQQTPAGGAQEGTILTLTDRGVHVPVNSDAPTSIRVGLFSGTGTSTKGDSLTRWVRSSPYANYQLSNGSLGTTTVADKTALLYTWDGLYQGTSVAVLNGTNVVLFSVTYNGAADLKKRQDFTTMMETVRFTQPQQ